MRKNINIFCMVLAITIASTPFSEEEEGRASWCKCCKSQPAPLARHEVTSFKETPQWVSYRKACLSQLTSARRWALTKKAREASTQLGLIGGATAATVAAVGGDSFGGSIAIFNGLFNGVFLLRDVISDAYTLLRTPAHPLDKLERRFATEKCFIPKKLWPSISEHFMMARQNPFAQQASMNRIEFMLGLTVHQPPKTALKNGEAHTRAERKLMRSILSRRMDKFFEGNYSLEKGHPYNKLKFNILNFADSLLNEDPDDESPHELSRYIYLRGPGGIGKTHFTLQLCQWIEDILGERDIIHVQNAIITSPAELEGSDNHPGVFLTMLRNQCLAGKRASIVVMDEANWINDGAMESHAKRVFNGRLGKLSTVYFGSGLDGTGIDLKMPPTLVILAANVEIKDPPLASRFDAFDYPAPKQEAAAKYGSTIYATMYDRFCAEEEEQQDEGKIDPRFDGDVRASKTFRDMESLMPALIVENPKFFADLQAGDEEKTSIAPSAASSSPHVVLRVRSSKRGKGLATPLLSMAGDRDDDDE